MNAISLLREQLKQAHELLENTVADVTPEQAHWIPPGIANPLGAIYAHALSVEDAVVNGLLKGNAPLFASAWKGKTGISEPQMHATFEWARKLKIDLSTAREYAQAVYAATDVYFASLQDDDLERVIDLSKSGFGPTPMNWIVNNMIVGHAHSMMGEISCLKGLQGAKGYPY
ncbi:MAG: DinB family protein [Chloroflexi bacterium]|nr:DinB family protein [Chloroflexota bacterium]